MMLTQLTDARCTVCPDRPMPVRTAWYTPYMEGITGPPPAIAFHTVTARTELLLILHSVLQVLGWSTPLSVFARIVSGMDADSVAVSLEPMALHIHCAARYALCAVRWFRCVRTAIDLAGGNVYLFFEHGPVAVGPGQPAHVAARVGRPRTAAYPGPGPRAHRDRVPRLSAQG